MDIDNLNDAEVNQLIATLKSPKNTISFSQAYHQISALFGKIDVEEPIIDDNDIEYFINAYQGRLEKNRFSIHLRFKDYHHHLIRVDVNPGINHKNPDDTKVIGSHIHIYSNRYDRRDAMATPLSDSDFPNINTIVDAFAEFLAYNNIK